jgi:type IV pilus biogenesis protein PilP
VTPRRRWTVISLAAMATAIAVWLGPEDNDAQVADVAAPVERDRTQSPAAAARAQQQPLATQLPTRQPIGRQRGDPFSPRSWAPPQQQQTQPTAAPQPPPNPYRFAGTVHHDGVRKVFLMLGDRVVEAKEGERLDQGFRVKSVTADAVTLIYEQIPDTPVTIKLAFSELPAPSAAGSAARGGTIAPLAPPSPP